MEAVYFADDQSAVNEFIQGASVKYPYKQKNSTNRFYLSSTRLLLLTFLLPLCVTVFSQKQDIKFEQIDIDKGLSQGNVLCTLQDSKGFIWFGTRDGLNKYDGYKFTVYKNDPDNPNSIVDNYINAMVEDSHGYIWIATWNGLSRFDRKLNSFTNFINNEKDPNTVASNLVTSLVEDAEHNIWIATDDRGIDKYEPGKNKFTHYRHNANDPHSISSNQLRYLLIDASGDLWAATDKGLNMFDKKTNSFKSFNHDPKNSNSISFDDLYCLYEDRRHDIWVGTNGGGLDLFDKQTQTFKHFRRDKSNANSISDDVIYIVSEAADGKIWIGTETYGLNIYDPRTGNFKHYLHDQLDNASLGNNTIFSILQDRNHNMWLGLFKGGLSVMKVDENRFVHFRNSSSKQSLSDNHVLSIFEDSRKLIWIGTSDGFNLFNRETGTFNTFKHEDGNNKTIGGNYILCITEDSRGNLWIGTWNEGITVFNPATKVYKHFKNDPSNPNSLSGNSIYSVFEDTEKNMWIATYGGGVNKYLPATNTFVHYKYDMDGVAGPNSKRPTTFYEDRDGNMWIGTDGGGINILNKKTNSFTQYVYRRGENTISSNTINGFFPDPDGNLWIATINGLNHFDFKTKKFTKYSTKNGLVDNNVFGVLADQQNNLWISTGRGLSKFNTIEKTFENFDVTDGLQSNEFKELAYCKSSTGELYFGGINGFNCFYPDSIKKITYDVPLVFTKFEIFNHDIPVATADHPTLLAVDISMTKEITLSYKESVFSFEFASLSYLAQSKKQYQYMMEGFDKEWNFVGTKHAATYTNLDPGEYTFKAMGLSSNGEWSTSLASIKLTITPPFWMTWWFKLLFVAACITGGIVFYRIRIYSIKAQQIKLQQLVNKQTEQLILSAEEEQKARRHSEEVNRDLQQKNKEVEQFAYIASHDLQEPLRTITSFIEMIQRQYKDKLDTKADKYFHFILDASYRMKTLIKDLLEYSRIGTERKLAPVDCNALLKNVSADLEIAISDAEAKIICEPLPTVQGYSTEIKQLFQNLLANAIKFRRKDMAPIIKFSCVDTGNYWQFSVADNGIGIEEEYKEKIFLIFQRLHNKTDYEGSGIGLAHCKKIVEIHGGQIWMESVPNEGTTFYFTIRKNKS